ncbi:MAG: DUF1565 domain-containing protein [Dehalococcoidia bacterium]|nr:DUF1565 domain-containing protein [Dehalococcoidia bacterium]
MKARNRLSASLRILLFVVIIVCLALPVAMTRPAQRSEGAQTTWYEQFLTGSSASSTYGNLVRAQTFTPTTTHCLNTVSFLLYKSGNPSFTVTISLQPTLNHLPTGTVLASTVFNASSLTTAAAWYVYTLPTGYNVQAGTEYALVLSANGGDAANYVVMRYNSSGGYARGMRVYSNDGGTTWITTTQDYAFKEGFTPTVVQVDNLQPSWTAPGGGGVYSAYYGPDNGYLAVSPGQTTLFNGREAGIIKAGLTPDPGDGHYWDEGLFGFTPNVTIDSLAAGPLTYDVINEEGTNPVWMTIEIDTGVVGNRDDDTVYQHVPTANPAEWHTVDAAAGQWQMWNDYNGDTSGNPLISLGEVAAAHTGLNVVRAYLRLGIGDSYHGDGDGTVGWVDKVTIGTTIYDFVVADLWYVDPAGSDSNRGSASSPFLTIQHAIDEAAAGDTIHVRAGTYAEQLTITKNLHLVGAGIGQSVIQAPATLPPASDPASAIVIVSGSGVNAEIDGFTVTGPGPSSCGSIAAGVFVTDGASANIHNNRIQDIRDSTFSGCQNGVGILVGRQVWSTTGTATISSNTIVGYQKGGIVVDNTGSSATITGNVVTGVGTTNIIAQNGIQISRGATATLSGNTVTGNSFHLEGNEWDWDSAGILLYQSGAVILSGGNTASGNDQNLCITGTTGAATLGTESLGPSSAPAGAGHDIVNDTGFDLDATGVTFVGAMSNAQIEALVWHQVDDAALGLVTWTPITADWYVATTGSDTTGDGTEGNPFLTIQHAINSASAGDTIHVAAGTYAQTITIDKTLALRGANNGVSAGVTPGSRGPESIIQGGVLIQGNNVVIDGFRIAGSDTFWGETTALFIVGGTSGHTICNNVIAGSDNSGSGPFAMVFGYYTSSITVSNNYIGHWRSTYINPTNAGSNLLFDGNHFDSNYVGIGSDGISGVTIQHNKFTGNNLEGFGTSNVGSNVQAHDNEFVGNAIGIRHYGGGQTVDAENNWWGDNSGPLDASDDTGSGGWYNPGGLGDPVSDRVDYDPWTTKTLAPNAWYEQFTTGSNTSALYGSLRRAQTFTPTTTHYLDTVSFWLYKSGNPSFTVTISLQPTLNHEPTGTVLASTVFSASSLTTTATWYIYSLPTGYNVQAATEYALVLSADGGDPYNYVVIRYNSKGGYPAGMRVYSNDGGATCVTTSEDYAFMEGQNPLGAPVPTWFEQWTTGSSTSVVYGVLRRAQTFTPTTAHSCRAVSFWLSKSGDPTFTVTISLQPTLDHIPTGTILASTTFYASSLTTTPTWFTYIFPTGYNVQAGTEYALVVSANGGDASNYVIMRYNSKGGYPGGMRVYSNDGGATWVTTNEDYAFMEGRV